MLMLGHVGRVSVQRVGIHCDKREYMVIELCNGLTGPVFVYIPGHEVLKISTKFSLTIVEHLDITSVDAEITYTEP